VRQRESSGALSMAGVPLARRSWWLLLRAPGIFFELPAARGRHDWRTVRRDFLGTYVSKG
jgi:hypothetical protein